MNDLVIVLLIVCGFWLVCAVLATSVLVMAATRTANRAEEYLKHRPNSLQQ
jgi:hypothetical protein